MMLTSVSYRFILRKWLYMFEDALRELFDVLELGHQISYDAATLVTTPALKFGENKKC